MTLNVDQYQWLVFERHPHGVLLITINRPEKLNAADEVMLDELARVWPDISRDDTVRVAVITGAGRAFSAGGDLTMERRKLGDFGRIDEMMRGARDLVVGITDCDKPIISAINGVAVGAGLAVALMADISIMAEEASFTDGHHRIGVAAGDHAAIIWPLLCGLAKARYYLLTADFIDGREAERIGLVSRCVPLDDLLDDALAIAERLATGPQHAIRYTKRAMSHWVRNAQPIFEAGLALEMMNFFGEDLPEGLDAIEQRRTPVFPSAM